MSKHICLIPSQNFNHAAKQAFISFGIPIAAAAELELDSTPVGGFDNAKLDVILNLKEKGLRSVVLLPTYFVPTCFRHLS